MKPKGPSMKVCVLRNETLPATRAALARVREAAKALGLSLVPESAARCADLFLVLGGDGSVLHAVRERAELGIPFLGVNIGSLGYLTATPLDGLEEALRAARDGECAVEERAMLRAQIRRGGNGRAGPAYLALNDLVAMRGGSGRVAAFDLVVDGAEVTTFIRNASFCVRRYVIGGEAVFEFPGYRLMTCVRGEGTADSVPVSVGQSFLVTAGSALRLAGKMTLMCTSEE